MRVNIDNLQVYFTLGNILPATCFLIFGTGLASAILGPISMTY